MKWELGGVAALLSVLLGVYYKRDKSTLEVDRKLFKRFLAILPSVGCMRFLKDHNFGDDFRLATLDPLQRFIESWDMPEFHFHDKKINKAREKLHSASKAFLEAIAKYTSPKRDESQGIYKYYNERHPIHQEDEDRLRKDMEDTIKTLNDFATVVFECDQALILLAKKRLKI